MAEQRERPFTWEDIAKKCKLPEARRLCGEFAMEEPQELTEAGLQELLDMRHAIYYPVEEEKQHVAAPIPIQATTSPPPTIPVREDEQIGNEVDGPFEIDASEW